MSFHRRLEALEKRLHGGDIHLVMGDGQEVHLRADPMKLLIGAMREYASGKLSETTQLVKNSIMSDEPGGSRLVELARAMLNSPSGEPETETEAFGEEIEQ
jgi:hypothetical protein